MVLKKDISVCPGGLWYGKSASRGGGGMPRICRRFTSSAQKTLLLEERDDPIIQHPHCL